MVCSFFYTVASTFIFYLIIGSVNIERNASNNIPKNVPKHVPKNVSKNFPKNISKNVTRSVSKNGNKNVTRKNNGIIIYTDPSKTDDKKFLTEIFPNLVKAFPNEEFKFYFIDENYSATKRMCAFDQWKKDYEKQQELFACEASGTILIDCINNIGWTDIDGIICAASKFKYYRHTSINNYNNLNVTNTPVITIGKRMVSQIFHDNVISFVCAYYGKKYRASCAGHKIVHGRQIKLLPPNLRLRATHTRNAPRPKVVNIFSNFTRPEDKEFFSEVFPRLASNFGREVRFDYYFIESPNASSKRMCALDQWKNAYDKQVSYFKCEAKNISEPDCIDIVGQSDIDAVICSATLVNDYANISARYYSHLKTNRTPIITIGKNVLEDTAFFKSKTFICLAHNFTFNKYTCASRNNSIVKFAKQSSSSGIVKMCKLIEVYLYICLYFVGGNWISNGLFRSSCVVKNVVKSC